MARPLVDVRDLEFFRAAYEDGAFSSAAKSLGTVQSNVSSRVGRLEARLGVPLFERRYRSVAPTREGEKLYRVSRHVFAALRLLERSVRPSTQEKRIRKPLRKRT